MTIFCIGRNYIDHIKELNNPLPQEPVIFMKPASALLLDNKPFYLPDFSNEIHHEVELVLKIGKPGKKIAEQNAKDYYSHIGLGIDLTARDIQDQCKAKGLPWEIAKAFDHSAVLGTMVPKEKYSLPISFSLLKNQELVQQADSSLMIFNFDQIISHISRYFRMNTGDLIYTGTPAGVGRVERGDLLDGYIGDQSYFRCQIK